MFCITLYPTPMMFYKTSGSGSINLTPFITTIHEFIKAFSLPEIYAGPFLKYLLITIIGNLVLFVPFGFFVPQLSKFKTFTKLMLAALVLSTGIEIIQYFLHFIGIYRSVDVDDIILNVTGAAVGFFILLAYRKIQNV